jgi:hypothetical protein
MVLVVLLAAVLTLLGISFALMGETEGRIASNELASVQALYVAESAARAVMGWFNEPGTGASLGFPPEAAVERGLRRIDHDGDPTTAPIAQDGLRWPRYKQGMDRDRDGRDDLFDRPYRGGLLDELVGTEDGPDVRIDEDGTPEARVFLQRLTRELLGDGAVPAGGLEAKIRRIDVFEPPRLLLEGVWVRHGIGTVRVVGGIYAQSGERERVVAQRTVAVVLNEVPYGRDLLGPLRSCGTLVWTGELPVRWGAASDARGAALAGGHEDVRSSWPRVVPAEPALDLLWGWDDPESFVAYRSELEARRERIEDPWFRYLSGATLAGAPAGTQPYPFRWDPGAPLGDGTWPNHDHAGQDGTHSNLFQGLPGASCGDVGYGFWKSLALSGERGTRYYAWAGGSSFREDGNEPARTFRELTDGAEGILFFDTADGATPHDRDGDGEFDNLTPPIEIVGGAWGVRGFVYLNAQSLRVQDVVGRAAAFAAPGEPFQDANRNGRHEPDEPWVNLAYPDRVDGPFLADPEDSRQDDGSSGGPPSRNSRGPILTGSAVVWGVLRISGRFEASGSCVFDGAVLAGSVVGSSDDAGGPPRLFWDAGLVGGWPPDGWVSPRVHATRFGPQ